MTSRFPLAIALLFSLLVVGCSKAKPQGVREQTSPLTGIIKVDGQAAEGVEVQCNPEPGNSKINYPVVATTDKNGAFAVGTYQKGDGLPEGNYLLTFVWMEAGLTPKDKLKGAYTDPKKSKHKVTIELGEKKNDLGEIELVTKGSGK